MAEPDYFYSSLTAAQIEEHLKYSVVSNRTMTNAEIDSNGKQRFRQNIGAMSDSVGVVRYDTGQSLTNAQKSQALTNLGGVSGSTPGFVHYDTSQDLTDQQKIQARQNIGAASGDAGFGIKGFYATLSALRSAVPNPVQGMVYAIGPQSGTTNTYKIYAYDPTKTSASTWWIDCGPFQLPSADIDDSAIAPDKTWSSYKTSQYFSRPNLLANWYFVGGGSQQGDGYFPINQKKTTSHTLKFAFFIDGWYWRSSKTVSIISSGLRIPTATQDVSTEGYRLLCQEIPNGVENLLGKKVTISALISDYESTNSNAYGTLAIFGDDGTKYGSSITVGSVTFKGNGLVAKTIDVSEATLTNSSNRRAKYISIQIGQAANNSYGLGFTIKAIKLEIGDSQTLAYNTGTTSNPVWVLNDYPDYQAELIKCNTRQFTAEKYSTTSGTYSVGTVEHISNKKISYDVPNPNLLTNWYFVGGGSQKGSGVFPINQRAATTYAGASTTSGGTTVRQCIDCWNWRSLNTINLTVGSAGLSIPAADSIRSVIQPIENGKAILAGKTVTFSILISGFSGTGNGYAGLFNGSTLGALPQDPVVFSNDTRNYVTITGNGLFKKTGTIKGVGSLTNDYMNFAVAISAASSQCAFNVIAVKLELGSEQTLAHNEGTDDAPVWVLNEIPNFEEQEFLCKTNKAISTDKYAKKSVSGFFRKVSELGLATGSATVSEVFSAMPYESIAILNQGQLATDQRPMGSQTTSPTMGLVAGQFFIFRGNSDGYIMYFRNSGTSPLTNIYTMGINSSGIPSGIWLNISQTAYSPINGNITDAAYTITATDIGKTLQSTATNGTTFTLNKDVSDLFPVGAEVSIMQATTTGNQSAIVVLGSGLSGKISIGGQLFSATKVKTMGSYTPLAMKKANSTMWVFIGNAEVVL